MSKTQCLRTGNQQCEYRCNRSGVTYMSINKYQKGELFICISLSLNAQIFPEFDFTFCGYDYHKMSYLFYFSTQQSFKNK